MNKITHSGKTRKGNNFPLVIDVVGNDVIVRAGTFKHDNVEYELTDDSTYTPATAPTYIETAFGYLVKHKTTGAISVLVDEVKCDGVDTEFDFSVGNYDQLFPVFHLTVPAGGPLSGVDCHVFQYAEGEY